MALSVTNFYGGGPPSKRRRIEEDHADLLDGLCTDDWTNDLLSSDPIEDKYDGIGTMETRGSAEVCVEEEELVFEGTQAEEMVLPAALQESQQASGALIQPDIIFAQSQSQTLPNSQCIVPDSQFCGDPLPFGSENAAKSQVHDQDKEDESIYWQDEDDLCLDEIDSNLNLVNAIALDPERRTEAPFAAKSTLDTSAQSQRMQRRNPQQDGVPPPISQTDFQTTLQPPAAFTTARGNSFAPPSTQALERAARVLASPEAANPPAAPSTPTPLARCQTPPSIILERPPPRSMSLIRQAHVNNARQPLAQVNHNNFMRPAPRPFKTPTRSPFLPSTPTPVPHSHVSPSPAKNHDHRQQPLSSPSRSSPMSQNKGTPQPSHTRRINLQMPTTSRRSRLANQPKFITPFKNGIRPSQEQLEQKAREVRQRASQSQAEAFQLETAHKPKPQARPSKFTRHALFDLACGVDRKTWSEANLSLSLSAYALQAYSIPDYIIYIDSLNGKDVSFVHQGHYKGWREAHAGLLELGAEFISPEWTLNHWQLITWKAACLVKCNPSHFHDIWLWDTIFHQLMYRYEREINRSSRSAIKRIQEHDSSPAQPMILVVSQVFWSSPALNDFLPGLDDVNTPQVAQAEKEVVGMELTDGWYRIIAKLDPVLAYAAKRGKIAIGTKIAMTGCKLEATSREGNDVLEAQGKATLALSANSSSIAAWDAKLGFQKTTYIATLRSLSPEGGVAKLLDLTVVKLYPIGFTRPGEEGWAEGPWNVKEEALKQAAWERERAAAYDKVVQTFEKEAEALADLEQEIIRLLSGSLAAKEPNSMKDPDDLLEELLEMRNWGATLQGLSKSELFDLKSVVVERCVQKRAVAQADIDQEVEELCPLRDARSFRVIRVKDSYASNPGMEAQMTLWDVSCFEHVCENARYWVTNVRPARPNGWSRSTAASGEIFLSAGRSSQFIPRLM